MVERSILITHLLKHLLSIDSLNKDDIEKIFSKADYYLNEFIDKKFISDLLKGQIIVNLFFEPSTRTRNSFEIAAQRLGGMTLSPEIHSSSLIKGESVSDTIKTFEAMGASAVVIRHSEDGILQNIVQSIHPQLVIINAGEGRYHHPTQTLIDLYTIQQHKKNWANLKVALIGDILHSRVAHSLVQGLIIMGVEHIHLIGPESLIDTSFDAPQIKKFHRLNAGLRQCDVIVCLRLQKERMDSDQIPDTVAFHEQFGLTADQLVLAKSGAIVMHPGPVIRNVEISDEVANGPQSVIFQQVRNGVAVRMAILDLFLPTLKLN